MSLNLNKRIVIVGGGSAGVTVASLLEKSIASLPGYEVIFITGKVYYYHLVAGLRANTSNADIAEKITVPYDKLFKNQTLHKIIMKKVREVRKDSVVLEDGAEVPFEYCVVATGKQWMAPNDIPDSRVEAIEAMKKYRDRVAAAQNIVVIGGGAVGVEMAGEIASSFKGTKKDGLHTQLEDLDVTVHLGDRISGQYDFASGPSDLKTQQGHAIDDVDLVITATGGSLNTALLERQVPHAIFSNGVKIKSTFQLEDHDKIFVIGDLADLPEQKAAIKAGGHATIVQANIVNMINVRAVVDYRAPREGLVVSLGATGGMGYFDIPWFGKTTVGPWFAKTLKGKHLAVREGRAALGY